MPGLKNLCAFLTLAMTATLFAGCSENSDSSDSTSSVATKDRISSDKTLKVATCYSENFSFFTVRQIHKKDHSNEYFNFLDGFRNHEIPLGKIKTPRYTAGQQIHCFRINKITTALLMKPIDFSSWNAYDYPEDLAFYKSCIPWFRCISHEKMVLVNETNFSAFNELKKIGINFRLINNSNYI